MKKFIFSLGLIAMMLNLTNCAQHDEVNPAIEPKGDFELYASISRTANDGFNTVWSANDQINVFHAVANTTDYNSDGQFTLEDTATGRFLGNLNGTLESEAEYDWYAFYPYNQYYTTPANTDGGRVYIGSRSDDAQTQTGNNSMAHIAGTNYPMAGYAKATPANEAPALVFKHVSSLIEFEVVNGLSEDITISQIEFTATEDIVGYYYINFADYNNLGFTKYNTYQSSTATLAVVDGTAIAAGSSAKFYMAVKPFTAAAGKELTVSVVATSETGSGTHNKTITLDEEEVFSAGKIKNVKVNYTTAFEVAETELFTHVTTLDDITEGTYIIICGDYVLLNNSGSSKQAVTTYASKGLSINGNDINCAVPTECKWSFTGINTEMTLSPVDDSSMYLYSTKSGDGLRINTTKDTWSFSAGKSENCFYIKDANKLVHLAVYNNQDWRSYTSATQAQSNMSLYKLYDPNATPSPILSVTPTTIEDVSYEGGSATISYTISNPVDGVSATATSSEDWVSITSAEGAFNLTIAANDGDARTATVTIAYEGAVSKTVTVKQDAKPNENGGVNIELVFNTADYTKKVSSYTTTWEHTYGGYKYSIVNFNNNNAGWSYIKCGSKNGTSVASINTTFAIPWSVANVTVTVDAVTTSKINSTYLVVATDANFSNVVETVNASIAKGNVVYTITNPGANYYYKVVYDCAQGSSNGLVQISKVVYTAN